MNKFTREDETTTVDVVHFDGYDFSERMLEGVTFQATWVDKLDKYIIDGPIDCGKLLDWDNDPYLCGLNKQYWMKEAQDYIDDADVVYAADNDEELARE
jgi:hypothetical protein